MSGLNKSASKWDRNTCDNIPLCETILQLHKKCKCKHAILGTKLITQKM